MSYYNSVNVNHILFSKNNKATNLFKYMRKQEQSNNGPPL